MDFTVFIDPKISDFFFEKHSSFNLGVAITTLSIFIAIYSFAYKTKFNLRFKLRKELFFSVIALLSISIISVFLAEFNLLLPPFFFEIGGALFMLSAIIISSYIIFYPIKKITWFNVKKMDKVLDHFILERYQDNLIESLDDILYFYKSLLIFSLENKEAKIVVNNYLTSDRFLELLSEQKSLFNQTIKLYLESRSREKGHILRLINKLFVKSLENQKSSLNNLLNNDIHFDSLSYLDHLFINGTNIYFSELLFRDIRFARLSIHGKISYMKLIKRYFEIIYRRNNWYQYPDRYQKNTGYNDRLIQDFLKDVKSFFEGAYEKKDMELLLKELEGFAWHYRWAVKTRDKSEELRKKVGIFLYDIFQELIIRHESRHESIFRFELLNLFDEYIEIQENGSINNIAFGSFAEKIKEKIIKDKFGSNSRGYYPAMLKIYFYIFGHSIFSEKINQYELKILHLPILNKLKESFPKLYNGFKQEFYDLEVLPEEKKEKLQKEGRKIIGDFLPENVHYDYSDNSLTYYYSGGNHGSKIILSDLTDDIKSIPTIKI